MKTNTCATMGMGFLIFIGSIWAIVPFLSLLLGCRPPWHDLRIMSIGWMGGFAAALLIAWVIRRITVRR